MRLYSVAFLQCLAALAIIVGAVESAAASGTGCYLNVWRADNNNNLTYLGVPAGGQPTCSVTSCTNPSAPCNVSTTNSGGTVFVKCKCGQTSDSGCILTWNGTSLSGWGVTFCSPNCPEGQHCDDVAWVGGTWTGSPPRWIEKAADCLPCQ